ncbi:MAG TPA: cytochrome c [Piscirickettsiaceae bacterium]|nr:cytochrome c [Piscirickettsiaceae bacterium]HIQ40475.1 cytochrome c [Sulfurivirga caldicuralii]
MRRTSLITALGVTGMLLSTQTLASETIQMGKSLFEEAKCMACHTNRPFNGDNSRVSDFKSLSTMVEACNTNLGVGWFPEEVEAVAHYLNHHYYKFPVSKQ